MKRKKSSLTQALQQHQNKTIKQQQIAKRLLTAETKPTHAKKSNLINAGKKPFQSSNHAQVISRPLSMVDKDDRVLLVGEGNFSFTVTLVINHSHSGKLITATTIDTREMVLEKYPDAREFLRILEEKQVTILFELDACKLNQDKRLKKMTGGFDKVIFNFPHVGGSEPDQDRSVRANQVLILRFLRSVVGLLFHPNDNDDQMSIVNTSGKRRKTSVKARSYRQLPPDSDSDNHLIDDSDKEVDVVSTCKTGTVLITIGTCPPYSLWDVPKLAKNGKTLAHTILYPRYPDLKSKGDQPNYKVIRSFDFDRFINSTTTTTTTTTTVGGSSSSSPSVVPYQHRQTNGFKNSGLVKDSKPSNPRTFEFQLVS